MSHVWMSHVTHPNESRHASGWVMSHIWMSHVSHLNDPRHTSEWLMWHTWMCVWHECGMSHKHTDRKELAMGLFGLEIWLHPKELQTLLDILDEVFTCVTDLRVTHDYSFKCFIWLIHTCDVTYSYVQDDKSANYSRHCRQGLSREVGGWGRVPLERWGAGVEYHFQEI